MTHSGHHDGALVVLSVLIATLASYTALDLAGRVRASQGWAKHAWLTTAAVAMGTGIWAMHFIAMLALTIPGLNVDYNLGLTILSFILPIVVVGCSLQLGSRAGSGLGIVLLIGLFMGLGIVAMHYTGMRAMQTNAAVTYLIPWVIVSILIAVGASSVAAWLTLKDTRLRQRILAAPFMGIAIAGMHYAAMEGTVFTLLPHNPAMHHHASLGQQHLAMAIGGTTLIILFLTLAAAMVDRRFAHLAQREADAMRERKERYRALLETSAVVVWFATPDGMIKESQGWTEICGQGEDEYAHTGWLGALHPDDQANTQAIWKRAIAGGGFYQTEFRVLHKTGEFRWMYASAVPRRNEAGKIIEWVGSVADIHNRKQAEEEVWWVAHHDTLTGLPNRMQFHCQLDEALNEAKETETAVGLLMIDIDHFKDINDALGHDAGDALLKEITARIKGTLHGRGIAARFGGDEFAIILPNMTSVDEATALARSLSEAMSKPFVERGRTFSTRASIGVAVFPDHAESGKDLLKDADIALYQAKVRGRNQAVLYSPDMRAMIEQRIALFDDMRRANEDGWIVPFYQPKICLQSGRIAGFEALMRWRHPDGTVLTPDYFNPVFDDLDLAGAIGREILQQVIPDMQHWRAQGLDGVRMAFNLSSAEFLQTRLADDILGLLANAGIPTQDFEIEVTETVFLGHGACNASVTLERLHRAGIQIALDDFGTGYASLTHLKQFPVDHVKIDRSFISNLEQDAHDDAIVAAVIGLARSLNLHVTAEGVETEGQARRLQSLGCHSAQGYYYAHPMPAADVPAFLAARKPLDARAARAS